jgi:hypothetical protein
MSKPSTGALDVYKSSSQRMRTSLEPSLTKRMAIARKLFLRHWPLPPWYCIFCGDEIWITGSGSRSLVVHHVDMNKSNNKLYNIKPCHFGCHTGHHNQRRAGE